MEEMNLRDFIEYTYKKNPFHALETAKKLIELEAIERNLNLIWGIELDIKIKPSEKKEGRFYGESLIKALNKK